MQRYPADLAEWTVAGVGSLLDAVYWTEPVGDGWTWCVECECLVRSAALLEHLRSGHQAELTSAD